jgi:hypothetical protein
MYIDRTGGIAMARATERRVPVPRKQPPCPVQEMGVKGYRNAPVVKGQLYCERHLRKQDRVKTPS